MCRIITVQTSQYHPIFFVIFFVLSLALTGQGSLLKDNDIKNLDLSRLIYVSEEKLYDNFHEVDDLLNIGNQWAEQNRDLESQLILNRIKARLHFYRAEVKLGISLLHENLAQVENPNTYSHEMILNHLLLSEFFVLKFDFESAQKHLNEADKFSSVNDDSKLKLEKLKARGFYFLEKKKYKNSKECYTKAIYLAQTINDPDQIAFLTGKLAWLKTKMGDRSESLTMSLESLKKGIKRLTRAKVNTNIGAVYLFLLDWPSAEKYLQKSIELQKEVGVRNGIIDELNGLGVCYANQKRYSEAISTLERALKIKKEQHLYPGLVLNNLAGTYNEIGNEEKANMYYDEYAVQAKKHKDWEGLCGLYYNKGYYNFSAANYDLALKQFEKSYDIGMERVPAPLFWLINDMLSKTHEKLGNETQAKFYRNEFDKLNNTFNEIETLKKVGAVENNTKSTDKTPKNNLVIKTSIWICSIGLGVIFLIFYRRALSKKERLSTLQNKDKIDFYFQELFDRLDRSRDSQDPSIPPVIDMPEFLKKELSANHGWKAFDIHFEKVHGNFYKDLKSEFPNITSNDLNMCALLKLNISNKDIAQIMGISYNSVRKSQQRLTKKMNLDEGKNLRDFILQY